MNYAWLKRAITHELAYALLAFSLSLFGFGLGSVWGRRPPPPETGGSTLGAQIVVQGGVSGPSGGGGGIVFKTNGETVMVIRGDGSVYVHGKPIGDDRELLAGLRAWFAASQHTVDAPWGGGLPATTTGMFAEDPHDH